VAPQESVLSFRIARPVQVDPELIRFSFMKAAIFSIMGISEKSSMDNLLIRGPMQESYSN
jgi:hypothetical protein